ncbi:hypothetical protein SEVIR_3G049800v4 [Setaria viridis]|uniref:Uncharacterized protein n=1 Tax=Setaria viridis TaxID=4556 RepID=A0A4U6VJJ0_SETVI|nr:hypothetical protein SEVIR_3G049800v2 [Setaria viridis]
MAMVLTAAGGQRSATSSTAMYALVLDLGRQGKHAAAAARRTFRPPSIRTPSIPSVTGGDFDRERSIRRLRPMHASSPSVALVWSARTRWCLRLRRADADGEAFCRNSYAIRQFRRTTFFRGVFRCNVWS